MKKVIFLIICLLLINSLYADNKTVTGTIKPIYINSTVSLSSSEAILNKDQSYFFKINEQDIDVYKSQTTENGVNVIRFIVL